MSDLREGNRAAPEALDKLDDLNTALSMPDGFHALVKGNRRPLREHYGTALFPIPMEFDIGFEPVTIVRLAKALIESRCLQDGLLI